MESASLFQRSELSVQVAVEWLRLTIETIGAVVIAIGVVVALGLLVRSAVVRHAYDFNRVRLVLARHLTLALEFQLAADILSTAIAPSWDRIGKLAAIAIIRTALNYFLMIEMRSESAAAGEKSGSPPSGAAAP